MAVRSKEEAIATSDQDKKLMAEFGITSQVKVLFYYDGHTYERLSDAVNYAKKQHYKPRENNARRGDTKQDPKI